LLVEAYTLSSGELDFKENQLSLKGNVSIVQDEFKILSDSALIERKENSSHLKKASFDQHVLVKLPSNGTIFCDHSLIDFESQLGELKMDKGKILYTGEFNFQGQNYPLISYCKKAHFAFNSEDKTHFSIDELMLEGDLETRVDKKFTLNANRAKIQFFQDKTPPSFKTIELFSDEDSLEFDFLQSHINTCYFKLDLAEDRILLGQMKGSWGSVTKTLFSCSKLDYDKEKKFTVLSGPVELSNDLFSHFQTNGSLELTHFNPENLSTLKMIKILGPFSCSYLNHEIKSEQGMIIDHSRTIAIIAQTAAAHPILYRYKDIEITAEKLELRYDPVTLTILEVKFSHNVFIRLKESLYSFKQALAHELKFYPEDHLIKLSAKTEEKILFWTNDDDLAMTMDGLEIFIHPETKKIFCKTFGNVKSMLKKTSELKF
jgi:hypothetical protein